MLFLLLSILLKLSVGDGQSMSNFDCGAEKKWELTLKLLYFPFEAPWNEKEKIRLFFFCIKKSKI